MEQSTTNKISAAKQALDAYEAAVKAAHDALSEPPRGIGGTLMTVRERGMFDEIHLLSRKRSPWKHGGQNDSDKNHERQ